MLKVTRSRLQQYSVAGLCVGVALVLMLALDPWFAMTKTPFLLFFGAVMVSAWYKGLRAGLVSTFLSVLISDYFFIQPIYSLALDLPNTIRLVLFALQGILFSVLCEALRTAKRRAEVSLEKLQAAEVRYRYIVETAGEGIWLFDAQLRTEYVNPQLAQMLGYSVEEMLQRPIFDFMDQVAQSEAQRYIARLKQGMRQRFDFQFRCRDGSNLWTLVSTTPILAESGEFQGGLAMASNLSERKQIEESLQLREEQLRLFVEHAPAAIAMLDNQMRYILVSQRWLTDFQLQNQNIIDRSHYEVFPEIPDSWREIHASCLAGEVRKCEKELFPRANGSIDWVKWEIHPWRNRADEIGGIIIFTEVITERVQAEKALQSANNRIRKILESIAEAFVAFDREWRYTYVNQEAARLLQKPPEELLGKQVWNVYPELIGNTFYQEAHRAIAQQVPIELEEFSEVLHCWLEIRAYPSAEGLAVYFRDVTERKRGQSALEQSEAKFRRLFESNLVGVAFWNAEGFITDANDAYLRLVGYSRQEFDVLGKIKWHPLTPPEYNDVDNRALEEAFTTGVSSIYEKEYVRRDGTRVQVVLGIALMDDSHVNGVAFVLDISERKKAELERDRLLVAEQKARATAEAANRIKDEFLAVLSHELRSPLNAMLGWLTLLRTRKFDEAATARALETVERNARAQAQLVEDLLDVSRIIQGKLRLNVRAVDLLSVIEAAIDTVHPAALAKNIQLQPVLDPAAGPVFGDSDRLQQIVWNLLSNAVKFTPKGGRVQIRLERVHSHVEIIVADTGKGISPEFLPYVFERFRQADSSITRSFGGLGLGLSIVRNLVDLHGGSVHVESPGEGQGTTFTVKLPISPVSIKIEEPERVHPTVGGSLAFDCTPRLDGLRILVVDDEVDARELLIQILVECGAEVVAVATADEVIVALEEQTSDSRFDILISDIGMPEQDGYVLVRRVRTLDSNQGGRIPAVALTAYARAEDRKAALLAGFQSHVAKPVEPGELIAVIANLTGRTIS
ncbi:PAS/PAC sensor hybrid histidine kinase [Kalymmatonema gypsitolerans NIES-4073]|nr:PAS/PAC sensor hybrid histidine kinase [Scytonema sp. NIES-4073]